MKVFIFTILLLSGCSSMHTNKNSKCYLQTERDYCSYGYKMVGKMKFEENEYFTEVCCK